MITDISSYSISEINNKEFIKVNSIIFHQSIFSKRKYNNFIGVVINNVSPFFIVFCLFDNFSSSSNYRLISVRKSSIKSWCTHVIT